MPQPTTQSHDRSRWDSWPPTQILLRAPRLSPTNLDDPDEDLSMIDEDPLTYFLTPASGAGVMEEVDMLDFDAGIEDAKRPQEDVRSVSPSNLSGSLSRPPPPPLSPPRSSSLSPPSSPRTSRDHSPFSDSDDDDDGEEYIRFGTARSLSLSAPLTLRDFTESTHKLGMDALLSPSSFFVPTARGRGRSSRGYTTMRARTQSMSVRKMPHVWREPSPDVWSITEETDEAMELASQASGGNAGSWTENMDEQKGMKKRAARPKKRVRFVLPAKE